MTELSPALSALISLAEELDDRLNEIDARSEALRAEISTLLEARERIAGRREALNEELRARAATQGLLSEAQEASFDNPATIVERIKEAVADNGRVTAPDIISLESWRRAQETRHKIKSQPISMQDNAGEADALDEDPAPSPRPYNDGETSSSATANSSTYESSTLEEALTRVLASLSPREELMIRRTHGFGQFFETLDGTQLKGREHWLQRVVAEKCYMSQSSVSRALSKARRKLQHPSRTRQLHSHWENITPGEVSRAEAVVLWIFGGYYLGEQ